MSTIAPNPVTPNIEPVLYGRFASPFVRRVAVTLQLYTIPYRHEPLMPFGVDKLTLANVNPIARVPALQLADGEVLIDSAAIIDYLDGLVSAERVLIPIAGAPRRQVLKLLAIALGANEKLVSGLYERHFRPRQAWHLPWLAACDKQVSDGFKWLDAAFVGPWFTGAEITQADVTVAVFWLFGLAKRPSFFARLDCPQIDALAKRMQTLPSFQSTLPEAETLAQLS